MARSVLNNLTDIAMTSNGDLSIGPDGDFLFSQGADAVYQSIFFRLQTVRGDWQLQKQCGANLEQFFGATTGPALGTAIEDEVIYALTHDGFIAPSELELRVVPINVNEIAILLKIQLDQDPVIYIASLNLREGLLLTSR